MADHILEPAAQAIADNTSKPPFLYEIGPDAARKVLDDIQAAPIDKPDVDEKWITVRAEVGDAYLPEVDKRSEITVSPLRASTDELAGLPEAFVVVDENDVLRYNGILHDFMMLNPVRGSAASTAAVEQAIHVLRKGLGQ